MSNDTRFIIAKEFEFDYGHRIWNQEFDVRLAGTSEYKCRRLHGHRGKVVVYITSSDVEFIRSTGVIMDFTELRFLKNFIEKFIDHRTLLDVTDPFVDIVKKYIRFTNCYINGFPIFFNNFDEVVSYLVNSYSYKIASFEYINDSNILVEWTESFVICNFIPTAENFAKFFFDYLRSKFVQSHINVYQVEFYETPTAKAIYREH